MRKDYYVNLIAGAFRALNASRRRSFLTMLGIIIGVAAVTIIMAIGRSTLPNRKSKIYWWK
jgi:threonine/homoserine/homoserine lactone efflux protein